jgi:predicted TIM-barrel fold metal-dependent hydrolase
MQPIWLNHVWEYRDIDRVFWADKLDDFMPARIVDAHVHVDEPSTRIVEMTEAKRKQYWVAEVCEPMRAEELERADAVVYPGRDVSHLTMALPNLEFDMDADNAYVQRESARRDWPTLTVLNPHWNAERIARELATPGVIGLKPYYSMISNDPDTRDKHIEADIFDFLPHVALEQLDARGGWVTLHVPKADRLGHPSNIAQIRELRERYPNVVVVIAHFGRCYTLAHAQAALPQLADDDGLYWDCSAVMNPAVYRYALDLLGPQRILYGTDNPFFYMRGRRVWTETGYFNFTSADFHFNRDKHEPADVEATYTLYLYEQLAAIRAACEDLSLSRDDVVDLFYGNAHRLIEQVRSRKAAWT